VLESVDLGKRLGERAYQTRITTQQLRAGSTSIGLRVL
jgi:hypothetical protein